MMCGCLWHLWVTQQSFNLLSKAWMLNGCFFEYKSVLRKSSKAVEHGKFCSLVLKTSPHACITDPILQGSYCLH